MHYLMGYGKYSPLVTRDPVSDLLCCLVCSVRPGQSGYTHSTYAASEVHQRWAIPGRLRCGKGREMLPGRQAVLLGATAELSLLVGWWELLLVSSTA